MSRILVVDDEETVLRLIQRVLAGRSHAVTVTDNVETAAAHINAGEFDLLISDVRFPKGDGMELAAHFRRKFPRGRIILISGSLGLQKITSQAAALGIQESIAKPFDIDLIDAAIQRALA